MLNLECLRVTNRAPRAGRQADRFAHTIRRLTEARRDDAEASGGGSADTPVRTPRKSPATAAAKKDGSGSTDDSDAEPAARYAISATSHQGLIIETATGQRARLCVVDDDGNVLSGDIAPDAWRVAVGAYREFLMGSGHLKVHASAPGVAKA